MAKIEKKHEQDFTVIQNTIFKFNDKLPKGSKISFKAIGILFYLWHLPHDWEFHESEIAKHASDGIDKFRKGREELEKYGFVTKVRRRNEKGQVGQYSWLLDDSPEFKAEFLKKPGLDFPRQGNPKQEKPIQGNQTLQSTKGTKNLSNKELSSSDDPKSYEALEEYQKVWTFPNVVVQQDLISWIDELGNDLVKYAIKIAARNNVSKMGSHKYLKAIFKAWDENGVKTIEDAKKQNAKHENSRNNSYGNSNSNNSKKKEAGSYEGFDYF
ncbi:DnaD domain protein [Apilactobacillus micheneri]|uniref:DnaD domain-containing protein n=1 Tax=Apilactobacillus micheneri TaxID=1899430 RepID=UPI00112A7601|nr:DnaD domain protein [Apilactobacillus micheneri]TPR48154.1 DnaD domain protein [Apilactobacillus micheneri]